jgi:hypothetical protein
MTIFKKAVTLYSYRIETDLLNISILNTVARAKKELGHRLRICELTLLLRFFTPDNETYFNFVSNTPPLMDLKEAISIL